MDNRFSNRHARALSMHFGPLDALVHPRAVNYPDFKDKIARTGHAVYSIDENTICVYGHISRAIYQIGLVNGAVLARGYGDVGVCLTDDGRQPGERWRAVAPLTAEAHRRGTAWRSKGKDRGSCGPASLAWWRDIEGSGRQYDEEQATVRMESAIMMGRAEAAFAVALFTLERNQADVRKSYR